MFKKLIRRKHFRTLRAQLRGAKKLRNRNEPFFVVDSVSSITEVNLGLNKDDFPKALVGSHGSIAEILLRQVLLSNYVKMCSAVMQSIGSGKPVSSPLPSSWRKHLTNNGVACSVFYCRVLLFLLSLKRLAFGFIKSLILLSPIKKPGYPGCPYVVFVSLPMGQKALPAPGGEKSYDLISWYKQSIIRKPDIRKIWVQAKVGKEYVAPEELVVTQSIFPKLGSFYSYIRFLFKNAKALFITIFGVLMGKWYYGFLYHESVFLNYFSLLDTDQLADNYFFPISNWFFKPLWTHEAEKKGASVSLYCTSVNMDKFWRHEEKEPDTYGLKVMLWNRFIVWDKQQENYFKQYRPRATFTRVGYIDYRGLTYSHFPKNNKKTLSVFDVYPGRPIFCTSSGYAIPMSLEETNILFMEDIIKVFNDGTWNILWKPKRDTTSNYNSNGFLRKQLNVIGDHMIIIDSNIAATSLIENSDVVISMPFSSPSLTAKVKGVPSIYYDRSGLVRYTENHGVPVLKSKVELKKWFESLPVNHTVNSRD
jgi:polysaccharide biosynthesis PFTS motif protein